MQISTKRFLLITTILVAVTGLSACKKSSGGGVVENAGGKKITFGYQFQCEDELVNVDPEQYQAHVTGQFQYKDREDDVALHGRIDSDNLEGAFISGLTCKDLTDVSEQLQHIIGDGHIAVGTYTPQPKNRGLGGDFLLRVTDQGPGCIDGDQLSLLILSGVYNGYEQVGCVEKGNISISSE